MATPIGWERVPDLSAVATAKAEGRVKVCVSPIPTPEQ